MLAVRLPAAAKSRFVELALVTGRPESFYVREARTGHLHDREDLRLAGRELAAIRADRPPTVALAEVT
ncbi:MAG: CopG family transcriptional regulator [Candidatus Accumulibacter sp.]|nr:CopG family transcriptional regulator [Accumulibacter sp.]